MLCNQDITQTVFQSLGWIAMLPNLRTPSQKSSEPMSAGPSISEDFPKLADIGSSMSDEVILPSADPSTMEVMADHWLNCDEIDIGIQVCLILIEPWVDHDLGQYPT
jgi:hypothetical protein